MRIAFTSTGKNWDAQIDPRLGRTAFIVVYDEDNDKLEVFDNTDSQNQAHGAGTATVQKIAGMNIDVIITGNGPGGNASEALSHLRTKIFINAQGMTLKQAYDEYKKGSLKSL